MEWIKRLFKKKTEFRLPKKGDKVGFSDNEIKKHPEWKSYCYGVRYSIGNENINIVYLDCGAVFYTGEWKLLPKHTPIKH
jgi:mRNA degradation ribonuclease J1/J2